MDCIGVGRGDEWMGRGVLSVILCYRYRGRSLGCGVVMGEDVKKEMVFVKFVCDLGCCFILLVGLIIFYSDGSMII